MFRWEKKCTGELCTQFLRGFGRYYSICESVWSVHIIFGYVEKKVKHPFWAPTSSSLTLCHWGHCALPPPPCACGCLAYYYALSGRLPGWWSLSELDTEISSRLWCVGHQGGRVELVWSSASRLTLVNGSNKTGLFLGGLFFINRVRGCHPGPAVSWVREGSQLRKRVEEGS